MPGAPPEFGPAIGYLTVPPEEDLPSHLHGKIVAALVLCYSGAVEDGRRLVQPFRDLGPEVDLMDAVAYVDFQSSIDDPPGYRNWWTAEYMDEIPDEALETIHRARSRDAQSRARPSRSSCRGAVRSRRVGEDDTPLAASGTRPGSSTRSPCGRTPRTTST